MSEQAIFVETVGLVGNAAPKLNLDIVEVSNHKGAAGHVFDIIKIKAGLPVLFARATPQPAAQLRTLKQLFTLRPAAHRAGVTDASLWTSVLASTLGMSVIPLPDDRQKWQAVIDDLFAKPLAEDTCFINFDAFNGAIKEMTSIAVDHLHKELDAAVKELDLTVDAKAKELLAKLRAPSREFIDDAEDQVLDTSAIEAAMVLRDRLLAEETWYSSEQVATLVRGNAVNSNPGQFANALRAQGRLLGVRSKGKRLHPAFQFQPNSGEPFRAMKDILSVLPDDESGWSAAMWFFQPTRRLGGARPADVLQRDPGAVIAAAEKDFRGDDGI